jgi:hypothetical protein
VGGGTPIHLRASYAPSFLKEAAEDALRYVECIWQNRLATFEENEGNIDIRNELIGTTARLPGFLQGIFG